MRRSVLLLITALACCTAAIAHEQHLEGTEWGVVGDNEASARYVSFAGSGRIFGFAGCNRLSGQYEQHDSHIVISPLAMTKKACAPDIMAKEQGFIDMLSKARSVKVDHTLLLFLDEAGADLKALMRRSAEPVKEESE